MMKQFGSPITKPQLRWFLVVVLVTMVILAFIDKTCYTEIQINGLNLVNKYFPVKDLDSSNKTSKTGHYRIPKCTCANGTEMEHKLTDTKTLRNDLASLLWKIRSGTMLKNVTTSSISSKPLNHKVNRFVNVKSNDRVTLIAKSLSNVNTGSQYAGDVRDVNTIDNSETNTTRCMKCLPDCIIIGVQKCGTKALAEFLKIHPNISLDSRQTYYFSQNYDKGLDWYRDQLPCSESNHLTLERTPQYFYYKEAPRRIYAMNKLIKLILILCNPVTRTISNFAMAKDRERADAKAVLEDCVLGTDGYINASCKYVAKSNYQQFMKYWLKTFPLVQIHVANGGQLIENPVHELQKVEKFLGIPSFVKDEHFIVNEKTGFRCVRNSTKGEKKRKCLSRKKGRQHPRVDDHVLSLLKQYFKPRNRELFYLVRQEFDWL